MLKVGQSLLGMSAGILLFWWLFPRWWSYVCLGAAVVELLSLASTLISAGMHIKDKDPPPTDQDYDKY